MTCTRLFFRQSKSVNDLAFIRVKDGTFTVVDADMFDELNAFKWTKDIDGHVYRYQRVASRNYKKVHMHRVVNKSPDTHMTDHRNLITWDNRRLNLRVADKSQNSANRKKSKRSGLSSVFKGVSFHKSTGLWRARVHLNGFETCAYFKTEGEAALVYNALAAQHFGEYARGNPAETVGVHVDPAPEWLPERALERN